MKFLKNNLKVIIGFIVGLILASSITVYAYSYFSSDIVYTREGTEIENVSQALNDLYEKANANATYTVIDKKDVGESSTYNYTITSNDLKYKSIMVIAIAVNVSSNSGAIAGVTVSNQNITPIYDPSTYQYNDARTICFLRYIYRNNK